MRKSEKTYIRIMDTMEQLLENNSYESISIAMLARECNLSRQAFYKYFSDKEELVLKMNERFCYDAITTEGSFTWKELVTHFTERIIAHKRFYVSTSRADDREVLYRVFYQPVIEQYRRMIEFRLKRPIDKDLYELLEFYLNGGIHITVDWVYDRMRVPAEHMVELFYRGMPKEIQDLLTGYHFPKDLTL